MPFYFSVSILSDLRILCFLDISIDYEVLEGGGGWLGV